MRNFVKSAVLLLLLFSSCKKDAMIHEVTMWPVPMMLMPGPV